ncbi:DNA phosphorothioation-associated putative methyltransferase [Parashewanella tropica]|uniref:DNA phosphorothioation-associated putative methyltransferase n=1 Tax=Parashewanella tropica TaxID=2547970 RepID=UPI0010594E7C|nr:DNA phosphorothioation-associated putative methyltransferase [Parashewanella tropica]
MDAATFKQLTSLVKAGKHLPDAIYIHKDAFSAIPKQLQDFIPAVAKALSVHEEQWDLVKLFKKEFRVSLLSYPTFYTDSYPSLQQSINVDLVKLQHKITSYDGSENPPILHRKETMVLPNSEHYQHFVDITQEGENAGLYENTRIIGFKRTWQNLIQSKGYELIDGRLFRSSSIITDDDNSEKIDRHKTAIVRHELSAPMKLLAKHGFLSGDYSIFDYGCGRGDDLRELQAHGLDALGWDPNYQPDNEKINSDIVNLGFVLNVIEDQDERIEALINAWELTDKFLVVSVMLAANSYIAQFTPYKDGVITSRNTFQKYYAQSEIKAYIERILQENVVTLAPGIFIIFKDKIEEQNYLIAKYSRHHQWQQLTSPEPIQAKDKAKLIITQNSDLFTDFWNVCLELGRIPVNEEFSKSEEIRQLIGSHKKVFSLLCEMYDTQAFTEAQQSRKEDLLLLFAMGLFEKRKPYTKQPENLKRDIKAFFDNYNICINEAKEILFKIAEPSLIEELCIDSHKSLPAGLINYEHAQPHSFTFHKKFVDDLPLLLRVYVGAALQMYGELETVQLIKIHIHSGKVTLLSYKGFDDSPLPQLEERIKIKMADQEVDFFDYLIPEKRPLLLNKCEFIDDSFADFKKQKAFNKRLLVELAKYELLPEPNLTKPALGLVLANEGLAVKGYRFSKS